MLAQKFALARFAAPLQWIKREHPEGSPKEQTIQKVDRPNRSLDDAIKTVTLELAAAQLNEAPYRNWIIR
jgi:hypothetical protein